MRKIKKWCIQGLFWIGICLVFWYLTYVWKLAIEAKELLMLHEEQKSISAQEDPIIFEVYYYDLLKKMFCSLEEATEYASTLKRSYITQMGKEDWLWDNYYSFIVYRDQQYMKDFDNFISALEYAKTHNHNCFRKKNILV